VTSARAFALRAALALSSLTGDRLAKAARRVLGEARFVALTGAEGNGARDASGALPVSAGRHVDSTDGRTFPLVLIVVTGAGGAQLDDVAERVATAQREGTRIRPVFVVDSGDLAAFRPHGFVVDHVLDRETLCALSPDEDHQAYVALRVAALERLYGAQRTLRVDLAGVGDDAAQLTSLVAQLVSDPRTT